MRISDWSSDVCSSDLLVYQEREYDLEQPFNRWSMRDAVARFNPEFDTGKTSDREYLAAFAKKVGADAKASYGAGKLLTEIFEKTRSEEHTSELQSLMRISYAVFGLKKKKKTNQKQQIARDTH